MSDEQLDIDGNPQPIEAPAPSGEHEQEKLFASAESIPGQMVLDD